MASFTPCQTSGVLHGQNTQVFLQTFADRILVLVTQIGKVGSLFQATLPDTASLIPHSSESPDQDHLLLPEPSPAIQLTPLFGSAPSEHLQTLYSLYVTQIATIIWRHESQRGLESSRRSVVVGLALSKLDSPEGEMRTEKEVFEGVMSMLHDLLKQE